MEREEEDYHQDVIIQQARLWEEEQLYFREYNKMMLRKHPRKRKRDYKLKR